MRDSHVQIQIFALTCHVIHVQASYNYCLLVMSATFANVNNNNRRNILVAYQALFQFDFLSDFDVVNFVTIVQVLYK